MKLSKLERELLNLVKKCWEVNVETPADIQACKHLAELGLIRFNENTGWAEVL